MGLVAELFGWIETGNPPKKDGKTFGFDFMIQDRGFLPSLIYASRFIFINFMAFFPMTPISLNRQEIQATFL